MTDHATPTAGSGAGTDPGTDPRSDPGTDAGTDPRATLAADGLALDLVDLADADAVKRWLRAESRGFHKSSQSDEKLAAQAQGLGDDRVVGVWDRSGAEPETPVATVRSWVMGLTVPGGDTLQAWAISAVTVAPTHRRRGIARALLSTELRAAHEAGLPMAMLTVSEATIYGRFGFGPAAAAAHYLIDTRRARWVGAIPAGRVQFVSPESLLADGPAVYERSRRHSPGEVDRRDELWRNILGLAPSKPGTDKRGQRTVRYDDAHGDAQGFALYRFLHENGDYPGRLELVDLVAATDDAYAALWRYFLEMDLITEVTAALRNVDEPVAWQVDDIRAVRKSDERDHLWLRILDVPVALSQRTYSVPGDYVLDVADELGFAGGSYLLSVDRDGSGTAHPLVGAAPPDAARVTLHVRDLSALYLGGVSAVTLARAGRIEEQTTDAAAQLDAAFHSAQTPRLSTWF